jgi:hypothetical protein
MIAAGKPPVRMEAEKIGSPIQSAPRNDPSMSSRSPGQRVLWLSVCAAAAAGGWWTGRILLVRPAPAEQPARVSPTALTTATGKKSRVDAASPAGQWMARVKIAAPADFPALHQELQTTFDFADDNERHIAALKFLFAVWMTRDPDAALAFVIGGNATTYALYDAADLAGTICPERVAALLNGPGADTLPKEFTDHAFYALAQTHPEIYLRINPQDTHENSSNEWGLALKGLAVKDPVAAAAVWSGRQFDYEKPDPSYLSVIVTMWRARDPAAARAWAESIPAGFNRQTALHAWLSAAARESPANAFQELAFFDLGESAGYPSLDDALAAEAAGDARLEIAGCIAKRDFADALAISQQLADSFPRGKSGENPLQVVRQWMARVKIMTLPDDPIGLLTELDAMSHAARPVDGNDDWWIDIQNECLPGKIAGWSVEDCLMALRLRGVATDDPSANAFIRRAALADPAFTVAALPEMPEEFRSVFIHTLFSALPHQETALRTSLLRQLPPEEWNHSLVVSLRGEEVTYAPVLAAFPPESNGQIRAAFASQWAGSDPAAAAAWVASLPFQEEVLLEAGAVVDTWVQLDETEASAWVASLPSGAPRDDAAASLAKAIRHVDPDAAWQWAFSIDDDVRRRVTLATLRVLLGETIYDIPGTDGPVPDKDAPPSKGNIDSSLSPP